MKTPTMCEHWVFVNQDICEDCFQKATSEFKQSLSTLKKLLEKCRNAKDGAVFDSKELPGDRLL